MAEKGFYECVDCGQICRRENSKQKRCFYCQQIHRSYIRRMQQYQRRQMQKESAKKIIEKLSVKEIKKEQKKMTWMNKKLYNMVAAAKQPTFELNGWILVTPELAKALLAYNVSNYRVLSKSTAMKYAEDMKKGLWEKNGEPIIFSKDGIQRNGQHRLEGVIIAKVPVMMYFIFDADSVNIYDMQKKRTCVQALRAMDYSVMNLSTAAARTMINGNFNSVNKVGDGEICSYVIKHYELLKKTENIIKTRIGKEKMVANKTSCAVIAYCLLRNKEIPESEIIDFFKVVNSNKKCGVKKDVSSALALRKQIDSYDGHGDSLNNRFMEFTYLAIKDFHNNVKVDKNFIYPENGKNAERLIKEIQCMDGYCSMGNAA